jgi:hypothetical protein
LLGGAQEATKPRESCALGPLKTPFVAMQRRASKAEDAPKAQQLPHRPVEMGEKKRKKLLDLSTWLENRKNGGGDKK